MPIGHPSAVVNVGLESAMISSFEIAGSLNFLDRAAAAPDRPPALPVRRQYNDTG
jgi:hypothetical protein